MSETNKKRSSKEVQVAFTQVCVKAGELKWQIRNMEKDLAMHEVELDALSFEYKSALRAEEEAAKAAAEQKQEEAKS